MEMPSPILIFEAQNGSPIKSIWSTDEFIFFANASAFSKVSVKPTNITSSYSSWGINFAMVLVEPFDLNIKL